MFDFVPHSHSCKQSMSCRVNDAMIVIKMTMLIQLVNFIH